ncbi:MAG: AsmA family protein, partial [Deltaproteobacteria bacterium]
GSYNEKPFELAGTLGSLLLLKEAGRPYPVNLTAKAAGSRFIVEGTIQNILRLKGLALKVGAEVVSSSQAASFFDKSLPVELGPLQASAAIAGDTDKGYQISDLKIASKAGDAEGTLGFSLEGARPKISGSMTSRRIDLSFLLDHGRTTQPRAEAGARKSRIFPNEPLSLDMLTQVDLQIKLNAEQVQLPQILLTSLSMEASAKDGRLALSPIKLKASGGDTEGHVELQHQGRLAMAKAIFKVSGMDLHLLSTDLKAEGKVDADLDLFGRGASIAGFMAGLNGRAVLVMGHGRVDNKTIQLLGGELGSGVFQLLNPSSKTANHTDINCAVSGFDIKDGMAKVTGLVVDTPDMIIIGEGQVNLRDETLDLSLKPYGKGGAAGVSLSLGELAKSFKLGGTLAHPSLKIDAAQTMITAGKAAGGVLLFGPAGIVAALAGESSGGGNPCLTALEAANKGVKASGSEKGKGQKATEEKGVSGTLKAVGESVKKFFSGQGTRPPSDRRSNPLGGEGP